MESIWDQLAQRIVAGVDLKPGELIELRDQAGNQKLLHALLLAIEAAGATALPQIVTAAYVERLLELSPLEHLTSWDRHRAVWAGQIDRVIILGAASPDLSQAPAEARAAFLAADGRVEAIIEERRLPCLVVAVPAVAKAAQLGIEHQDLERHLLPALLVGADELQGSIARVLAALGAAEELLIRSGQGYELRVRRGGRPWLSDDGRIDPADRGRGAVVSNLPGGSIYTTVIEDSAEGSLAVLLAGPARAAVLHFSDGRVGAIEAASGGPALEAMLDSHSGEPRRISHLGIGLNPRLQRPIGWTLVDEHVFGCVFMALGENRYMGGQNASSLNIDYALPGVSLLADGRMIIEEGRLVV